MTSTEENNDRIGNTSTIETFRMCKKCNQTTTAENICEKCVRQFKQHENDDNTNLLIEKWELCHEKASKYYLHGDFKRSLSENKKALKFAKQLKDQMRIADCYNNIGVIKSMKNKYVKALKYYNRALNIQIVLNGEDHLCVGEIFNNIGVVYADLGIHDEAEQYFNKAYRISVKQRGMSHPKTKQILENVEHLRHTYF